MAFIKGHKKAGGKKAGTPNKTTGEARQAIATFVDGNIDRLNGWLDQIAVQNPLAAFNAFMSVIEYHIPKLQRQEVTGKDGGAIKVENVSENDKSILAQWEQELLNRKKDK